MAMFLRYVYEAAQNLPLIAGCFVAIRFWQDGKWLPALMAMAVAGALAAVVIWVTEPLIYRGHRETGRQLAGNMIVFPVLMLVCTLYFTARWSSGWTDLAAGLLLAVGLAIGQETAARERFGFIRVLWLGVSCVGSLLMFRALMNRPLWISITVVEIWFTVVMETYKELRMRGYIGGTTPAGQPARHAPEGQPQ